MTFFRVPNAVHLSADRNKDISMHKVFVFGTLKEGFPNFATNKGVRYPGDFQTKNRYPLYLVGDRYSPWLILNRGYGHQVQGQVFLVNDDVLRQMDMLERIQAADGYRRVELTVVDKATGEEIDVFAYGKPLDQLYGARIQQEIPGDYTLAHSALYRSRQAVA